ncbi:MAG TPA: NAD(P)(+) transhydrogenase (Re/Si-specific) subunit beta [Longimicrobiaceae bacterium]|nr:NAD(P)(+) transhydrogenase (Re/Si-specific) subunit beta [Longimicrobiaceae bacterium]
MIPSGLEALLYLVAASLFIIGLKRLSSPATARRGNLISGVGMLLAVVVTLFDRAIVSYGVILAGMVVGTALGVWMARSVRMTAMPQMVALLNGLGGAASLLVGGGEFLRAELLGEQVPVDTGVSIQLAILIGAVTFSGSLVAWAKLQEVMPGRPLTFPGQKGVNALLFLSVVGLSVYQLATPDPILWPFYAVVAVSLLLGVLLVIPIGGADMPVVISLLNSYSGIAAAMTGFVIGNSVLVISGALVGSSGIILSQIMCRAMNRSLINVLFGAFGASTGGAARSAEGLTARQIAAEDLAIQLAYAQRVVVIPGYGMAVAQAQHQVRELAELIERNGGEVRYAIHPVAGRMPGHMNVLLAEANVPYDRMITDVEEANAYTAQADVALVIGANDIVNPAALDEPGSPIYGMPIIRADTARRSVVMKRSMASGFAGIENDLFYRENNYMLFGDAKASLSALIAEIKQEVGAAV